MLSRDVASIIKFLKQFCSKVYYGDVQLGAVTPSIYVPTPEMEYLPNSSGGGANQFALFVKVFDRDSISAFELAGKIVDGVQSSARTIYLIDDDGELTETKMHFTKVTMKIIDTGVAQIYFVWKSYPGYTPYSGDKANAFIMDLTKK